jgi:alpha-glucosidase
VFPLQGAGEFEATCFEDDGRSQACRDGDHGQWRLTVTSSLQDLHVAIAREGRRPPTQDHLVLRLPLSETRTLAFMGAALEQDSPDGDWRQLTLNLRRRASLVVHPDALDP